jgi:hypothetical protein
MDLQIVFTQRDNLLQFDVTGEWSLEGARALIDRIALESEGNGCRRALVDALQIEVAGRVLEYERYVMGGYILSRLAGIRLAVLFPADQITKFTEGVVRGAGAPMLVTSDRAEALAWL